MVETKLVAKKRTRLGTSECRRLRRQGIIPGNICGHKQPPVAIAVDADQLDAVLRSGHRLVECEVDGVTETAMFREIQFDTFGTEVQHFDLVRIDANERVTVEVPIELRGTSPGVLAGGILEQPLHEVTVDCLAAQIPDSIVVRINALHIGDSISVADLELPPNVHCHNPPEAAVVQVTAAQEVPVEEEAEIGPAEPELVGEKKEESESSD